MSKKEISKKGNAASTNRPFFLVTLSHAETRNVPRKVVLDRILGCFSCEAVAVAKELHQDKGYHFHAAVQSNNASRYTTSKKIREIFPEFEGMQCDVRFKKAWPPMCEYITKQDKEPLVWGQYSLHQVLEAAEAHKKHKSTEENAIGRAEGIVQRMQQCKEWIDIYDDPLLTKEAIRSYSSLRSIFDDLLIVKDKKTTTAERISKYLFEHGEPLEYTIEELKDKYVILDWIACQLCFKRPVKTKQLFIYGEPSTQKTLIFSMLAKALNVYFASSRKNDFSGAHNYYDIWVFDEFHEPEENSGLYSSTETGSAYANTLLKMLDGQECRLDSKYSRVFTKRTNVPIVMIANRIPHAFFKGGPLKERFITIKSQHTVEDLIEERIIATLWGCILRRYKMKASYAGETDIPINYNLIKGNFYFEFLKKGFQITNNEGWITHGERENKGVIRLRMRTFDGGDPGIKEQEEVCYMNIEEQDLTKNKLTMIDFAIIPLEKRGGRKLRENEEMEGGTDEGEPEDIDDFPLYGRKDAKFRIFRYKNKDIMDYASWPIIISFMNKMSDHCDAAWGSNLPLSMREEKLNAYINFVQREGFLNRMETREELKEKVEEQKNSEGKIIKLYRAVIGGTFEGS